MWTDLTVPDAERTRTFYEAVVGWTSQPVAMDGYNDHCMYRPGHDQTPVGGICHARGENANIPPVWLVYITVAHLDTSLEACLRLGGRVLAPARDVQGSRMAIIQDPAGAVAALYQPAAAEGASADA